VPLAHDTNVPIAEQSLHPQFRSACCLHNTGFKVNCPVAKRCTVFVRLLHEAKTHAGCFVSDSRNEVRSEVLHKAFAGSQREDAGKLFEIEFLCRTQDRFSILHDLTDALAKFERAGRGHELASRPDQEWIAGRFPQSCQRPAHRRGAEAQSLGRAGYVSFREQHIEGDQQIEVGARHEPKGSRYGVKRNDTLQSVRLPPCHAFA
jgi:hypothetical protein